MSLAAQLSTGIDQLQLDIPAAQQELLLDYVALLQKWNKAFNLTAVRQPAEMVSRHLLDSLSILPAVTGKTVIDVGTGAGLPGLPLAICLPDTQFTLLDGNGKKTRFCQQAAVSLGLKNVSVVHARVEEHQPELLFDQVTARAWAVLAIIVGSAGHLLKPDGELLAMKGRWPDEELADLPAGWDVHGKPLQVPGVEGERHLLRLTRTPQTVKNR